MIPGPPPITVYLVMYTDAHGITHTYSSPSATSATCDVLALRAAGYQAGWDAIDPLSGDSGEGMA